MPSCGGTTNNWSRTQAPGRGPVLFSRRPRQQDRQTHASSDRPLLWCRLVPRLRESPGTRDCKCPFGCVTLHRLLREHGVQHLRQRTLTSSRSRTQTGAASSRSPSRRSRSIRNSLHRCSPRAIQRGQVSLMLAQRDRALEARSSEVWLRVRKREVDLPNVVGGQQAEWVSRGNWEDPRDASDGGGQE